MTAPVENDRVAVWFSADRPIEQRSKDLLGRRAFAESLATAIREWKGRDSLVIALYGPWGEGKTSVKNMAVEALKESHGASIVEASAWEFANRDKLSESLLDQIGLGLRRGAVASDKDRRAIVRRWRTFAKYFETFARTVPDPDTVVSWSLGSAGLAALFTAAFPQFRLAASIIGIGLVLAFVTTALSRLANWVADLLEIRTGLGRRTLTEVKSELSEALVRLKRPVLVVVDDLDRLTPDETNEVLQLVRANADFPNLVYLLLGQRETIEAHLTTALRVDGRNYLDKVVQVAFDIPVVDRGRVHRVLIAGLDRLLTDSSASKGFDERRWGNLFFGALESYFDNLRSVNRYLSSLTFHISIFRSGNTLEVNPIDLIGLEALRVFEPDVYREVARSKEFLTKADPWKSGRDASDELKRKVQSLFALSSAPNRSRTEALLRQLFPRVDGLLDGMVHGPESYEAWHRQLRICSAEFFERYFQLAVPEGEISQATIERLLEASSDRVKLRTAFLQLDEEDRLPAALESLEPYKQEIPTANSGPFVTALMDVGDRLSNETPGILDTSPQAQAGRLIYWNLRCIENPSERSKVLTDAVETTDGLVVPVEIVASECQRRKEKASAEKRLTEDGALDRLEQMCIEKIRKTANDGSLVTKPGFVGLLYRWRAWGGEKEPQEYSRRLITTPEGVVAFIRGFMTRSHSQQVSDYVAMVRPLVRLSDVERFAPIEDVEAALSTIEISSLSEPEQLAVRAFRDAIERRESGAGSEEDDHPA